MKDFVYIHQLAKQLAIYKDGSNSDLPWGVSCFKSFQFQWALYVTPLPQTQTTWDTAESKPLYPPQDRACHNASQTKLDPPQVLNLFTHIKFSKIKREHTTINTLNNCIPTTEFYSNSGWNLAYQDNCYVFAAW